MRFFLLFVLFIMVAFVGCQESKKQPYLIGAQQSHINPNSLVAKAQEREKDRQNQVELKRLETEANVEIAKIQTAKDIEISKIDAQTKQNVALTTSSVQKEQTKTHLYIAIAFAIILLIGLFLWYLNGKKSRELQAKLHEQKLQNDAMLKAQEIENERINKLLELCEKGILPEGVQKDVIQTAIISTTKTIEYKKGS
ncbi:hypothetical protein MNB_SM-7-1118 [hydrothermal vent metagenome]|uniref:Uncharacterized protein n=1 Tax=hydrothermal vent metagenome TaxID=652676 RepID=A0A1W1BAQ7_9ZZZZ